MVSNLELLELIDNWENSGVEFKRDEITNHKLAKTLVAFSNLEGGMLILGVEDDRTIKGLTRDDLEEWVMTTCRDKIRPGIIPYFETIKDVEPGKDVAIVRVSRGIDVHSLWHNNKHTYFIRVGSESREPSPEELSRLFQQRGAIRTDLRPIVGSTIGDLDQRRLKDYFERVRQQQVPEGNDISEWHKLLVNTEIMIDERTSLSGLLLFGNFPKRFLPQAGIDAVTFAGTEKDYSIKERQSIIGPMVPLMDQHNNVLETGVIDQALEFVRRNTSLTAYIDDGGRRVECPAFPKEVVREALVNALIHRDYLLANVDIELAIYQNRLEIISPGRLPNGVTPERMRIGIRATRNQLLKDVMRDYDYLEHMGMGVPRKIILGMKQHNDTEPELIEDGERFTVRLFS